MKARVALGFLERYIYIVSAGETTLNSLFHEFDLTFCVLFSGERAFEEEARAD